MTRQNDLVQAAIDESPRWCLSLKFPALDAGSPSGAASYMLSGMDKATRDKFISEWTEMRASLERQLELLESGKMGTGDTLVLGSSTARTIVRVKGCIAELNEMIERASHDA